VRLIVYPYNLGSKSAKELAAAIGAIRVRKDGNYKHRAGDLVINWGNGAVPAWGTKVAIQSMLNKPQYVRCASEKVRTFESLQASDLAKYLPNWTTSQQTARGWFNGPNPYGSLKRAVVCRTLTRANSGRGIVLATDAGSVVPAPLYTRYKPKQSEFRIHVHTRFGIMDAQQKRRRTDAAQSELGDYIRSYDNDWIFAREGIKVPSLVGEVAEMAVHRLGLDFGAVDIGFHDHYGVAIYEVNTAPGIEGQTLANYAQTFKRYLSA
jgi:hypothetical protein